MRGDFPSRTPAEGSTREGLPPRARHLSCPRAPRAGCRSEGAIPCRALAVGGAGCIMPQILAESTMTKTADRNTARPPSSRGRQAADDAKLEVSDDPGCLQAAMAALFREGEGE